MSITGPLPAVLNFLCTYLSVHRYCRCYAYRSSGGANMPIKCLRCFEPIEHHKRSMQIVASQDSEPRPGFSMNLYNCMNRGGPVYGTGMDDPPKQQGEGRFYRPAKQYN